MQQTKKTYMVLTALAHEDIGHELINLAASMGCHIDQSRIAVLGSEYTITLLLSGNWGAIAKLEAALPNFQQKYGLKLLTERTDTAKYDQPVLNYLVQIISHDREGLLEQITEFFAERTLTIVEMYTSTYVAVLTGTPMLTLNMTLQIPAEYIIAELREQFMTFCDELNLDAILEVER